MFHKIVLLSLALLLLALAATGCGEISAAEPLTVSQLISKADQYTGKNVTVEGFYYSAFEMNAMAEALFADSSGIYGPEGSLIWVAGGLPQNIIEGLIVETGTSYGYPVRYGKIKITGKFEAGDKYGHLGAYSYQIDVRDAELPDWTPPKPTPNPTTTCLPGSLQVKIVDPEGRPLAGGKVVSEEQPEGQPKVTGITGDDGTVTFNGIKAGVYRFYISRFDYEQTDFEINASSGLTTSATISLSPDHYSPSPSPTSSPGP